MTQIPGNDLFFPSTEVKKIRQLAQHNYHRVCEGLSNSASALIESQVIASSNHPTTFHVDTAGHLLLPAINTPTLESEIDRINHLMLANESKSDSAVSHTPTDIYAQRARLEAINLILCVVLPVPSFHSAVSMLLCPWREVHCDQLLPTSPQVRRARHCGGCGTIYWWSSK